MVIKMNYFPGLGLGRNQNGMTKLPDFCKQRDRSELGYKDKKGKEKMEEPMNVFRLKILTNYFI